MGRVPGLSDLRVGGDGPGMSKKGYILVYNFYVLSYGTLVGGAAAVAERAIDGARARVWE